MFVVVLAPHVIAMKLMIGTLFVQCLTIVFRWCLSNRVQFEGVQWVTASCSSVDLLSTITITCPIKAPKGHCPIFSPCASKAYFLSLLDNKFGKFDLIYSANTISHIKDLNNVFRNINLVLNMVRNAAVGYHSIDFFNT